MIAANKIYLPSSPGTGKGCFRREILSENFEEISILCWVFLHCQSWIDTRAKRFCTKHMRFGLAN